LFVSDLDISPDQEVQKFPVLPQLGEFEGNPTLGGLNANYRRIVHFA
jgi:hypothetical protein